MTWAALSGSLTFSITKQSSCWEGSMLGMGGNSQPASCLCLMD